MTGDQEAFKKALDNGTTAAWESQWEKAEQYYREALQQFPDHPLALSNLGLALVQQGALEKALNIFQHLVRVSPDNASAYDRTSRILERMGKTDEAVRWAMQAAELCLKNRDIEKAIDIWQWVVSIDADLALAHTRLGMVYERMGRKALAVESYLSAAGIEQRAGKLERASQWVARAISLMPDSPEARQAQAALVNNQPLQTIIPAQRSIARRSLQATVGMQEKRTADKTGMTPVESARQSALTILAGMLFDQAEAAQQAATQTNYELHGKRSALFSGSQNEAARVQQHLAQAIEAQSLGQYKQAAEDLQRVLDMGVKHPAIYFFLGWLYFGVDSRKSLKHLRTAIAAPEYTLAACLLMAEGQERDQKFTDAVVSYLQALRLADAQVVPPADMDEMLQIYEPIIESFSDRPDEGHAREICQAISKILNRPDWEGYLTALRLQLPEQAHGAPPIPVAQQLLETGSSEVLTAMMTIRQLGQEGKYYAAVEEAYRAINASPTYLPLHVQISELLLRAGRIQAGVEKLGYVAELYNLRGDSAQAVRLLMRAAQAAPMDLVVRNRLIDLLVEQGKINDAAQQYLDLGEMYYHLADLDMALKTYQAALTFADHNRAGVQWQVRMLSKLADIDMQRLDMRSATEHLVRLRQLQPEDVNTRLALVNVLTRLGRQGEALAEIDDALKLYEAKRLDQAALDVLHKAIGEYPENLELRKRLANQYARQGQKELAVKELDHIADTLLANGNRMGAIAMVKAIVALNPPNVAEYQELLQGLLGGGA